MLNLLIEITAFDPTSKTPTIIRMASASATERGVYLDNKTWLPVIIAGPKFKFELFAEGNFKPLDISYSQISFLLADVFANYNWPALSFNGSTASVWLGNDGDAFTSYRKLWTGTLGPVVRDDDRTGHLVLLGAEAPLSTANLLSVNYAGTGGAEGDASKVGAPKPYSIGACINVEPVLIDPVKWIYQVNGYGASPVTMIYESAAKVRDTSDGDTANYAALAALTLPEGHWATCAASGLVRLGAAPKGKITADCGTSTTVGAVMGDLLARAGVLPAFVDASVTGASRAYRLYLTEQSTIIDVVRDAAFAAGGYLVADSTGKFCLASFASTKTALPLNADRSTTPLVLPDTIMQVEPTVPAWRVRVGYDRVWSVMAASDISPAVADLSANMVATNAAAKAAQDAANAAQVTATTALTSITNWSTDGIIDGSEKLQLVQRYSAIVAEYSPLSTNAGNAGITTEKTAYDNAYSALTSYLNGLSPAYTDTTAATTVDATTFNGKFTNYYIARQNLDNATFNLAKTTAKWTNVDNRPTDLASLNTADGTKLSGIATGADVTGNNTSKDTNAVGGTPASTIIGAIKDSGGNIVGVQALKDATAAAAQTAATARSEAAQVRTDLTPTIAAAQSDATAAKTDAATARNDLATEVSRAKGAEGTLSTRITTAQSTADGAATAITTETTQRTNADAALANRATTLESKQGSNGAINLNPMFASYTNATGPADGWGGDDQTNGGASRVAGETGGYALQTASTAAKSCYSCTALPAISAYTWWVVEADVKLTAGTLAGSGILFRNGTQDFNISFVTEKDTTDAVVGAGTVGQTYRFRKLVQTTVAAASPVLYYMTHYSAFGSIAAANTLIWYRCAVRPASSAEIMAQKADTALNTPTTGVIARITTEETTRATQDTAIANRATALEATVNNSTTGVAAVNTKISDEATARSNADTSLGNRTSTLESTVNNGSTGLAATYARIAAEETTRANADTSIANRTSTLEVRAGNNASYTTANAAFTAWPDGSPYPSQFQLWNPGTFTREASSYTSGAYMLGHIVPGTGDSGLYTNFYATAGYWVLEASVYCSAGTFQGAGIYVDNVPSLNFSTAPDTNGIIGVSSTGIRNFSLLVQAPSSAYVNFYLMGNWSAFGTTTAKTLHWLRAGVRPASDGEIKAMKADAALNTPGSGVIARIGTEETARANGDTALSNRTSNLESSVNNATTGLAATYTRIGAEETTRANAVSSVASRTNTLETRFGNATNFTNANASFAAWQDGAAYPAQWSAWYSGNVSREAGFTNGSYMVGHNLGATDGGISTTFYVTPGYWVYEASVWCSTGTLQGAGLYVDNLPALNFSTVADINGTIGAGTTGIRNWSYMVQSTYGGQVNLYAMTNWGSFAPVTGKVIHWLKAGIRPASSAEILAMKADATLNNSGGIVARMGSEETARANGDSALSNRTASLETGFTKLNAAPNLLGPLNDWTGPGSFTQNGYWGPTFQWGGNLGDSEQVFAQSPRVYLAGDATYTLSCDLLAVGGATVYANMDVVGYDANNNLVLDSPNTNNLTNGDFSDTRGIGAIAVTFTTPSTLTYAYVRLLGNARNVARADIGCRKVKLERNTSATAYSDNMAVTVVNASLKDEATTRSNADGALSNRTSSLEASVYTGGTGLLARMSTEENARASADSALASRTNTLEASVSGGNLLTSSNFNNGSQGWGFAYNNASLQSPINAAGDDWHPISENALSIIQPNNDGSLYGYWYSDLVPVNVGQWYQFSAYVASHRADSGIGFESWNYNASTLANSWQPVRISRGSGANGGKDLNSWDHVYFNYQADQPLLKMQLWKWGTNGSNSDSYAWFVRPQLVQVANGNAPLVPYSPASGSASLSGVSSRVTTSEAAISNLNGRASAYWQVQSVAGNNRAQLTVRADANGGAGIDIVGDVNFSGNLNVGPDSGQRTKITNQGVFIYDGNGVRRVALGINF